MHQIKNVDEVRAFDKVFILITDVDKISQATFSNIITELARLRVAWNFVFPSTKECLWNSDEIEYYYLKIYDTLKEVPQNETYFDYFFKKRKENLSLQIPQDKCIKPNCKHQITKETKENYRKILHMYAVNAERSV